MTNPFPGALNPGENVHYRAGNPTVERSDAVVAVAVDRMASMPDRGHVPT